MADALQAQLEKLRGSLTLLETQRAVLGDALTPAIEAVQQQIATLEAQLAPQHSPLEERRLITILFTDVVGSTSLAEKLDPEDWRQTVARLHETVGNIIAQHHGTVAQYLGDGLLAFFGAQNPGEQDPENAVRAALEFQSAVGAGFKPAPTNPAILLRVGIHTGLVVVGELGAASHREFTGTGDAMNLAARLQSAAPPGGILISHETYRYVRGVFDVTPQPPLTVKGKTEPIQTYLVRRSKPRPFRTVVRGVAGVETRTVGRARETQQLQGAYLDAYENKRVVWAQLIGEPGVGKSRLLEDIREWVELRPETVWLLKARAYSEDSRQPFALVRRMWFDRFQIAEDAPLALAEAKWVEQFNTYLGREDVEAAHALGLLVGLPFESSPYIGAMRNEPAQIKGRAFAVSRELFNAMRAQNPIELLLEDLHVADAASVEYFVEVVWGADGRGETLRSAKLANSGQAPDENLNGIFVLGTARPEWEIPDEFRREIAGNLSPEFIEIPIAPLSDAATRELVGELLQRVENVPDQVVEMIVERSEGVPYFAEEMLNYFIDRGIIDQSVEPWRFVVGRLRESPLPATLQHLLFTRLSALNDDERAALQRGAIFGRNFWTGGVQALGARASDAVLNELQPRGFVVAQPDSSFDGEQEWSFHHNLLRDVTYESVLKRERAALHKKAAEWLEQQARAVERLDEFAGLLGEHLEKAGELNRAAEWFVRVGERAMGQGAPQQARDFFDRALALLPPIEREQRWRALSGHEAALNVLGEFEAQQADLNALLGLADELQDDERRAIAWVRQVHVLAHADDYRGALRAAEQAIGFADRAGAESTALVARSLQAFVLGRLGEWRAARTLAEAVIGQARGLSDDASASQGLGRAAIVLSESGDLARAVELYQEAAELARRSGDRLVEANSLGNLGYTYMQLGLYKQGRATMQHALEVNQAQSARRERAFNLLNLGLAYFRLGDGRAARRLLDEGVRETVAVGDEIGRVWGLLYVALELERSGDLSGAARRYQETVDAFNKGGGPAIGHDARAGLARCAFGQGQLDEAQSHMGILWSYLQGQGTEGMEFPVWAYLTCADLFDALGDAETSRAAIEAGYRELMARAEKISDAEWRKSFLENVPEHRAMVELWERSTMAKTL